MIAIETEAGGDLGVWKFNNTMFSFKGMREKSVGTVIVPIFGTLGHFSIGFKFCGDYFCFYTSRTDNLYKDEHQQNHHLQIV